MVKRDYSHMTEEDWNHWTNVYLFNKEEKANLDSLPDSNYLTTVLKMECWKRQSLMYSEEERRRTFRSHWPLHGVNWEACANAGFYYIGIADRTQCAFCDGIIKNWRTGDNPHYAHKRSFPTCRFAQKKATNNIPYAGYSGNNNSMSDVTNFIDEKYARNALANAINAKPKSNDMSMKLKKSSTAVTPKYSTPQERSKTFISGFEKVCPVPAQSLNDAGFYSLGDGDKVKCFWCDGALEQWTKGDDPWQEHAKWYPGCQLLRETKGTEFIKKARDTLTAEEKDLATTLEYNCGDLTFLDNP